MMHKTVMFSPRPIVSTLTKRCQSTAVAASTTAVRPWEDIPSFPKGKNMDIIQFILAMNFKILGLPFLGNLHMLFKKPNGIEKMTENLNDLINKLDPDRIGLLRCEAKYFNPEGDGRILFAYEPDLVRTVYQNEGQYPHRGNAFDLIRAWRDDRPDLFSETRGLLIEEKEKWHAMRSKVQQDMMRPKSAMFYLEDLMSNDFANYIQRQYVDQNTVTPDDFVDDCYKFGLESISIIALHCRMGCFDVRINTFCKNF